MNTGREQIDANTACREKCIVGETYVWPDFLFGKIKGRCYHVCKSPDKILVWKKIAWAYDRPSSSRVKPTFKI